MTSAFENPMDFLKRRLFGVQPRNNAYCDHEIERLRFERQSMRICEVQADPILHAAMNSMLTRHLKHGCCRVHRIDGVALACEGHGYQPCAAPDFEDARIHPKPEFPDPLK